MVANGILLVSMIILPRSTPLSAKVPFLKAKSQLLFSRNTLQISRTVTSFDYLGTPLAMDTDVNGELGTTPSRGFKIRLLLGMELFFLGG